MNIPIPRFLASWIFNKYGQQLVKEQSQKASKIDKIIVSPGSGSAKWSEHDYENFAKETYLKNIIAFRCIDILGTAFSSVPWKVYEVKGSNNKTETKQHPVAKLIKKPNPLDSFSFLMLKAISFLVMSGNTYSERVKLDTGPNKGVVKELYIHRPDRVHIEVNTDTGQLKGYVYEVQGRKIEWKVDPITMECDLWHFKTFHPINDWYGAAVTESAAREIDTSNEATEWNKKLLENEGRPGMVVTITGQNLSDEKFDKLENMLLEKHSGVENVGRNLILEGEKGTKAEPYGWTPKDMDFIEGNNMLARRIALGFKVPPMLMGIPGDATFCLPYNSKIRMSDNTEKCIGEIKEGDYVFSFDIKKGGLVSKKVTWQGKVGEKKTYKIKTIDDWFGRTCDVEATDNHPFLVTHIDNNGNRSFKYTQLKDLSNGDKLISLDSISNVFIKEDIFYGENEIPREYLNTTQLVGQKIDDAFLTIVENKIQSVYDIEVEGTHNFFANGVCVHNSNYEEARLAFWEEAIFFYLNFFRDELNAWFFPFSNKFHIDYALDDIPALAGKRHRMWERANKAQFITINEKRAMVSLPPRSGGDVILVPSNMVPLDLLIKEYEDSGNEEEDEGKVKDKLKKKGMTEEEALKYMGLE